MKAKAITIRGLKCDTTGCEYDQLEPVGDDFEDWELWLNAPCPFCGASLLTEQDLTTMKHTLKLIRFLNKVLTPWAWICHKLGLKKVTFAMGMDGSGKINPRRIP